MAHERWFELVSAAVDGQLAPAEQDRLDAHLETCADCRRDRQRLEADRRRWRLQEPDGHPDLTERILAARRGAGGATPASPTGGPTRTLVRRAGAVAAAAAAVVALLVVAVADDAPAPVSSAAPAAGSDVIVDARGTTFDRADVSISAGSTVEWRNTGAVHHKLVRELGPATVIEDLSPGRSDLAEFTEPGVYDFFCEIHPGMHGTVTVEA